MTYVLLSAVFISAAVLIAVLTAVLRRRSGVRGFSIKALFAAGAGLMVLTAIFDNVIIGVGLVDYTDEQISGLRIGLAPLEDFSYPLAGVILLPALWVLFGLLSSSKESHDR